MLYTYTFCRAFRISSIRFCLYSYAIYLHILQGFPHFLYTFLPVFLCYILTHFVELSAFPLYVSACIPMLYTYTFCRDFRISSIRFCLYSYAMYIHILQGFPHFLYTFLPVFLCYIHTHFVGLSAFPLFVSACIPMLYTVINGLLGLVL